MKLIDKKNYDALFFLLACVIFFAFLVFTIGGEDGLLKLLQLNKVKSELALKNREILLENLSLRQTQKSLTHPKVIEHLARESLGFVYPDEVVYVTRKDEIIR